ncbi:MAG: bifunctional chorismate mutase/prephenate dehydrogenase [Verrucomicrobia bacterium]|nr:bifunctional chorismate mutase/prephenate dehydrogenase [Verrucomicrobiota bacterium]
MVRGGGGERVAEAAGATGEALEGLRRQIDEIDERIVELLARRHGVIQRVVALKKSAHLPIYHPAREEYLISQRRHQARQAGLDPDHIEELYRSIMRQSRVRQTVHAATTAVRPGARVLVVGGGGQMGSYLARWFRGAGYVVGILEVNDWGRVKTLCEGVDLAVVSVPIHATVGVIRQLAPHLPGGCVLADVTSIKKTPVDAMLAAHRGPVVGLHPLFGPSTSSMDKQIVVASPGRDDEACQWVLDQLSAWGNIVMTVNAVEHDQAMDLVQAIRHFATFAFGRFLAQRHINLLRTLEFSSPIYRLELGMVGRLFAQDPALYADIIFASAERRALLKDYVESLADTQALMATGDRAKFSDEFHRIAEWFGPFCEQAMRESSFLIEKLVERF